MRLGLVVGEEGEFLTLHEETEMADRGVSCKEFFVEGGVFGLCRGKFLGEESKGGPGVTEMLLKDSTHMRDASTAREMAALGSG